MHSTRLLIPMLLLGSLPAQAVAQGVWRDLQLRRPEVLDPEMHGFHASRSAGKVVELVLGVGSRVPLVRPVSEWQIAELPGQVYVILAGGIRESLDLYLFESKIGSVEVIGTDGGRLLPAEFGVDQGSWPLFEGRALVFFPYEKNGRLQVIVVNFEGQVLARQTLPSTVAAFAVEIDRSSYQVRVSFGAQAEPMFFLHPAAPRLTLGSGLMLFSGPERRSLQLRNHGRRPLPVDLRIEGQGYRIIGPKSRVIPASASREITVEMSLPADVHAQLEITSPVQGADAVVGLQNLIALPSAAESPPAMVESGIDVAPAQRHQPEGETRAAAPVKPEIPQPLMDEKETVGFEILRIDGKRVEVRGIPTLTHGQSPLPEVLVRNRSSGEVQSGAMAADGSFCITILAVAGDDLDCAFAVPGGEPDYRDLGPILPGLTSENGALIASGRVGAELMLLQVLAGEADGLPQRVLRSWRLRLDGRGKVRVPLRSLGDAVGPRSFLLLSQRSGGRLSQTEVVSVAGGFNQRR